MNIIFGVVVALAVSGYFTAATNLAISMATQQKCNLNWHILFATVFTGIAAGMVY